MSAERNITSTIKAEVAGALIQPILLADLVFDSGHLRLWTGFGNLTWNSQTWTGTGYLGTVSTIEETTALEAKGLDFQLSGLPGEMLGLVLTEKMQGRPANIWLGFLDSSGNVLSDPVGPFGYFMDYSEIHEATDTATIVLHTENKLRILDAASNRKSTQEDQHIDYPADLGYEYVPSLQDKQLTWG